MPFKAFRLNLLAKYFGLCYTDDNEANFGERLATLKRGTETHLYRSFEKDGVEISGGEAQYYTK